MKTCIGTCATENLVFFFNFLSFSLIFHRFFDRLFVVCGISLKIGIVCLCLKKISICMNLFVFGCCFRALKSFCLILCFFLTGKKPITNSNWQETNHKLKLARNQSQNVRMADWENDLLSTWENDLLSKMVHEVVVNHFIS